MAINIKTPGVHHVTLRVADFRRARQFYAETLGFPVALEQPDLLVILAGNTAVGIRAPAKGTPKGDTFNPFRVGLRSEEHTSELQSRLHLVCRLLLEKKKLPLDITSLLLHIIFDARFLLGH